MIKAPHTKSAPCNLPSDRSRTPPWSWGTLKAHPGPSLSESELRRVEDVVQEVSGLPSNLEGQNYTPSAA